MICNMSPKHVFLDLEVDRVPKEKNEPLPCITQIAIYDPSREKGQRVFNAYVQPHVELALKSINNNRLFFKDVWPKVVAWLNEGLNGDRQVVIIGHNAFEHDAKVLKKEVERVYATTQIAFPRHWHFFCTAYLKNALKIGGNNTLTGICSNLKVKIRNAHDAIEDAKMTKGIFNKMIGLLPLKKDGSNEDRKTKLLNEDLLQKVLLASLAPFNEHPVRKVADLIRLSGNKNLDVKIAKEIAPFDTAVTKKITNIMLIFFDFETTGLIETIGEIKKYPRVVQLAGYIPSTKAIFNSLVNPEMQIPRISSTIHGIYDEDVKNAKTFKAVWLEFQDFIKLHLNNRPNTIPVLAGHNVWGYDMAVYKNEAEQTGLTKLFWKSFDTLFLAKNRFAGIKGPFMKGFFKQEYLAPLFGINISGAHDAKNDVIASSKLFKAFIKGVDEEDCHKAILADHPIKALGEHCKDFDGTFYFELYKKACGLTVDFAKMHFEDILDPSFFEPLNLSATLDIHVEVDDPELYTLWRIFLNLTEGIDRKIVNKALQEKKPLDALMRLSQEGHAFNADNYKKTTMMACQIVVPLAKVLFEGKSELFFEPENLFALFGMTLNEEVTIFDNKRLFLKFTRGVPKEALEKALLSSNAADEIAALILEKGRFSPESYLSKGTSSNAMEVIGEKNSLKREAEDEHYVSSKKVKTKK